LAVKDIFVRVGEEEIGRILNLKEHLDLKELLLTYAPHYQQLGWVLVGIKSPEGSPLELDLSQPTEVWGQELADLGVDIGQINIAVRTGGFSSLLVLEVNQGEGALSLDQWGDWRADCVAEVGGRREQHYYSLPAGTQAPPSFFLAPQVLIYGEGGLVLVPPSVEPQAQEPWRWLQPPWEKPPRPPKPAVWRFLKEYIPAVMVKPQVPSWPEIYQLVASHGSLLQALLVPPASQGEYYQSIVKTALELNLRDPELLLGLLWHAPLGESRHDPDKWDYFHALVARALGRPVEGDSTAMLPALANKKTSPDNAETASSPGSPAVQPSLEVLGMFPGPAASDPGLQELEGASPPRFEQSISGQFFQLLAGLGEKVIMESCRYEAMLAGLQGQAGEIDNLVSQWEQHFAGSSPLPSGEQAMVSRNTVEFDWDAIINQNALKKQKIQEIQTVANDFLKQNPDLADDRHKVQMVIFCLRNYISLNPEFAGMPFREKLDRAGIMARGFFRTRGECY
jgi:hypothetical protein